MACDAFLSSSDPEQDYALFLDDAVSTMEAGPMNVVIASFTFFASMVCETGLGSK